MQFYECDDADTVDADTAAVAADGISINIIVIVRMYE